MFRLVKTVPLLSEAPGANPVWINLTRRTHHSFMEVMLSSMNEVRRDGDKNMVTFKFSCNLDCVCSRCRAVSRPLRWDLGFQSGGLDHAWRSRLGVHMFMVVGNRQLAIAAVAQVRVSRWSFGPCTESP